MMLSAFKGSFTNISKAITVMEGTKQWQVTLRCTVYGQKVQAQSKSIYLLLALPSLPQMAYLQCRQAEAIGQVMRFLFRNLLFTKSQPQLLKRHHTDVVGYIVTLRVQGVG